VAWRLKEHGYSFSQAYWRLREGKGLLSSYDQESLKQLSSLITCVRRFTGPLKKLTPVDQRELNVKRDELLIKMEAYRDRLEAGVNPQYLYDGTSPIVIEHVLSGIIGNVRELDTEQQQEIWESLDVDKVKNEAAFCMKEAEEFMKEYVQAEDKNGMPTPDEWMKKRFCGKFVKDKVWQIRTGHDERSSVNAGISQRLNFIWDIPTLTDEVHRNIYMKNQAVLDAYREWKEHHRDFDVDYTVVLEKANQVLNSLEIPTID
jgi:hypothetical protein